MSSVDVQRMPSTPLAPREYKDDSLIASKLSTDLDKKFVSSSKQVLLQRIEFKPATKPDEQYEKLKKKYPPLNATHGSSIQHYRNGGLSTSEVSAEEDIPVPKNVLHAPGNLQLEWKSVRRIGPGLSNMGNTCFLNSVLQVLTYTAPLVNYLSTGAGHCKDCHVVGFCMMCELQRHILRTFGHNQNDTIKPLAIIKKLKLIAKPFKYGHQEDAHEFLRYVIDGMQKSCLPGDKKLDRYSKETSLVHRIFGGYYRSQVRCLKCHNTSNTFDPLMEIMLDIKHAPSVTRALHRSVKIELLDGENLYQCPRCKKKVPAHKQVLIHRTPNILTVHLKRFDYNQMFGGKILKDVDYSEQLDLRPFMTTKGPPVLYRLYAVLVHSGYSCNSGHYYCFVRASNGTWYNMNDSMVRQVGLKAVLTQQAYLLFYSKVSKEEPKALTKGILRQTSLNIPTTPTSASTPNAPRLIREHDVGSPVSKDKSNAFAKTPPSSTSTITKPLPAAPAGASSGLTPQSDRPRLSFSIPVKSKVQPSKAGPANRSLNKAETSAVTTTAPAATDSSPTKSPVPTPSKDRGSELSSGEKAPATPTRADPTSSVQAGSFPLRKGDDSKSSPTPKKPRPPPLFIPRAVGQVSKRTPKDEGGKSATTPKATTPWKVTPKQGYEPMFGPMSPPPSGSVPPQQSPSSVRSDMSSSTSSIMGKSGEWTVSSKLEGIPGPRLPERQHAGWQVKDKGDSKREEVDSEEEEEERRKKKKKHKKEKRKRKEKKGKAKRKYRKLEGDSESEPLDNEEEGESEDKEKRKKNKKRKKKHKSKKRAGSDSCSDLDDETETTALLSKGSGDTKTRKRKIGRDKDEGGGAKKHRLVDYSDGSSSEGSVSADPGEKSKSKSKHSNNGSKDSKQVPVIHDGQSPAKSARKVLWDGSRGSSVVEKLLQSGGGLKGYGNSVTAWEGGQSAVDSQLHEDSGGERDQRDSDDEWNESIDRGKEKSSDRSRHDRRRHKSRNGYRKF